jgi:hypothetical protein
VVLVYCNSQGGSRSNQTLEGKKHLGAALAVPKLLHFMFPEETAAIGAFLVGATAALNAAIPVEL